MAIEAANGSAVANGSASKQGPLNLDASKLKVIRTEAPRAMPSPENLKFGQTMTDHMLVATYDPINGWSAPEIKPYGPFALDPASSCFHYSTNLFEGMKAYIGPDGKPRLFRPELNMARMKKSADRIALPPFDTEELLKLIKRLVAMDAHWIPTLPGHSMYIRPTMIGTRPNLGVAASDHAMIYVICCPTGPYFRTGARQISLLAMGETVRAWPGGTGGYKLALNYAPTLKPQQVAEQQGYNQVLWLLGDRVTEAGAMNFFVVVKRDDDNWDVYTPPLDGTILPGITRDSCLALAGAHPSRTVLPHLPETLRLHPQERPVTMSDLAQWHAEGRLLEAFTVGTAVVVTGVGRIGYQGKNIELPIHEGGRGPLAQALYERIMDIQEGKVEWEGWSVPCA
ncbi:branched-chain amino acid aminotransferase II [Wolfiporia cocos MD-104 SS10]|uniref:Branched-chain-amino-acid aminotransferase n=1 Tax=Wolfiporia cocos (strain MD-104) TaxID=742152 RepID=A0A2H3JVS1_WOLCO|nr:branched-chain amino acid aminotransferase II [Wolfiporia cocos MD-104 SS10]